jgi:hypothetical protein
MTLTSIAVLAVALAIALTALAVATSRRHPAQAKGPTAATRTPVETAMVLALGVGGVIALGRCAMELGRGLAQLPGADEHIFGDEVLWLIVALPIPVTGGLASLLAARWLSRHPIGAQQARTSWLTLLVFGLAWIGAVVTWALGQGNYVRMDDPLLWAPVGGLCGTIIGAALLGTFAIRRGSAPGEAPDRG